MSEIYKNNCFSEISRSTARICHLLSGSPENVARNCQKLPEMLPENVARNRQKNVARNPSFLIEYFQHSPFLK